MKEKLGFVGLGQMGKWMALNLLKAGHEMTVLDLDPQAVKFLTDQGAAAARNPAGLAGVSEVVFLSLPDASVVEPVIFGPEGLSRTLKPGAVVVDLSTTAYLPTLAFDRRLQAQGVTYCDAPVSGMEARAKDGTLTVMFGGPQEAFLRLRPLLDRLGNKILHLGAVGSGQLTKLVNQLLFNISCAGIAEILPLAVKLGLDPEKVLEVVTTGTGRSFAAEFFGPRALKGVFDEGYPMSAAYKDMISAAEISAQRKIPLPLVQAATTTYQMALNMGLGHENKGAMIKVFEKLLGVEFRKKEAEG